MPWVPELFSAPVLERLQEKWQRERLEAVPYFDGLMSGERDALVDSFAGEPELHDPIRGRVRGVRAFEAFSTEMNARLRQRNASVEDIHYVITKPRGFEEVVLHLDGEAGRVDVPVRVGRRGRIPARAGRRRRRRDQGDVRTGRLRPRACGWPVRPQRLDGLRAFYKHLFSNDGGIPLEHCALVDDGRACALEYNVVRWGKTELRPEAGVAVYVRGQSGKLAAARIYDDCDPPL